MHDILRFLRKASRSFKSIQRLIRKQNFIFKKFSTFFTKRQLLIFKQQKKRFRIMQIAFFKWKLCILYRIFKNEEKLLEKIIWNSIPKSLSRRWWNFPTFLWEISINLLWKHSDSSFLDEINSRSFVWTEFWSKWMKGIDLRIILWEK